VGGSFLAGPALFGLGLPMNFVVGTDRAHLERGFPDSSGCEAPRRPLAPCVYGFLRGIAASFTTGN